MIDWLIDWLIDWCFAGCNILLENAICIWMYLLRYIDDCLNSTPYVKPKDIIQTGRSIIILIVTLHNILHVSSIIFMSRSHRSWWHDGWIYYHLCMQCLSPLKLWVRIPLKRDMFDATLCDKVCQWLAASRWFSLGIPVSFTNKTDRHDITEILLKVSLVFSKARLLDYLSTCLLMSNRNNFS